ncbi:MAG TPA: oligopeptide transporter, OPT family [Rhizomicrobium sp.]|jgi:putative OPT family oligopeptide transporter|nr:oligopeptide transporter, OPT family [Rhizomicrobium sp.]
MTENRELTWRGIALGMSLTFLFTAANMYLGLKVGLTIATSIPAAVISMAFLGLFPGSNIRENNIVQTVCSAAGALASVIFILPSLVIIGWWTDFPFWTSFLLCASGGVLGVLFTIPLRRALVTQSDLPYPEGVAAAEVLKVGADMRAENPEAREGLLAVAYGALASAGLSIAAAMRLAADGVEGFFRTGAAAATGYTFSFSLALAGAGHLVGISVGLAMFAGILIAWAGAVPIITAVTPMHGDLASFVSGIWRNDVRFIGAGAMAVAAVWSLLRTMGPIVGGLKATMRARGGVVSLLDQTDRDMSFRAILVIGLVSTAISTWLVWRFSSEAGLTGAALWIALLSIPLVLAGGFFVSAICGYMAGLIGSSNSPISGVGILAVVGTALCLTLLFAGHGAKPMVAITLFVTAILFAVACSSNNNLQDLKTGQLVGAAPWRQQVALLAGVAAATVTVPVVLNLLAEAYGFSGAPNLHTIASQPLAAPQANLMAALAQGVIGGKLNWSMIEIGAGVGAGIVLLDEILRLGGLLRLPPLAVGLGIYLPMEATLPVVLGAIIGWVYNRSTRSRRAERLGVLVASGMIVGESLFGVLNAGLIVAFSKDAPLAVVGSSFPATAVAVTGFAGLIVLLYGWLFRRARTA